ncbi:kallikrein-7-like isoform X2 [Phymastichus coffea]|uniref:kallikrein-7-like isoform X2 n=1 Tax=Phymastichus coffea TaxID=108790 RepID=UPI00273B15B7|nr:kallikrein-7-like isoform X2 [Phymastichus coffea]
MMNRLYFMYCFAILNSKLVFSNGNPFMGYNVQQAEVHEFDFVVSISIKRYASLVLEEDYHICGGVLITTRYVITSAHCKCEGSGELEDYTVKVGHDLRNWEANYSIMSWKNFKRCCCPLYKRENTCNDIAVLKLAKDIRSKITRNIELPAINYSPIDQLYNKNATSADWGNVNSMLHPRYMQKVTMTTISMQECLRNINQAHRIAELNNDLPKNYVLESNILCSNGNRVPGVIPYTILGDGDSGGPLIIGKNQIIAINLDYEAEPFHFTFPIL